MNPMQKLSQLRRLLHSIETELGVKGFSECEKDIIAVFYDRKSDGPVTTSEISGDQIVACHSRPTIFRAIASLIERGVIERIGQSKSGVYRVTKDI